MKRQSIRGRAIAAGEKFSERHHGKPHIYEGQRYPTNAQFRAAMAYSAGWLAGYRKAKAEKRK